MGGGVKDIWEPSVRSASFCFENGSRNKAYFLNGKKKLYVFVFASLSRDDLILIALF